MILYTVYALGLTTFWGWNFYVNRNLLGLKFLCQQEHLVTLVICCKFKKNIFEVWFYTIVLHDFIHVYSTGAGAESSRVQSFDVNRNVLSLHSFVASLKKNVFEVWF